MTFRGKVVGDAIVLPAGISLPEGTEVTVEVENEPMSVRNGHAQPSIRNGVPVFAPVANAPQSDLALVNRLRDGAL